MALYEPIKRMLGEEEAHHQPLPLHRKLAAGSAAGAVGAALANPTDVLKVRQQADVRRGARPQSLWREWRAVYRAEGLRHGLYRGTLPTAGRAAILSAVFLPSYDQSKQWLLRRRLMDESVALHVVCGLLAGFCMALVSSPVDVVKTRYVSSSHGTRYRSVLHCCWLTARLDGLGAFYRGFLPTWARLGPHTLMALTLNEQLRKLLQFKPI